MKGVHFAGTKCRYRYGHGYRDWVLVFLFSFLVLVLLKDPRATFGSRWHGIGSIASWHSPVLNEYHECTRR